MAESLAVKLLENVMECAICTDDLQDARVLPCVHTFCLKCIDDWSRKKTPQGKISCPVCREKFVIPDEGTAALPKNCFVEKLLEAKKLLSSFSKGDTFCDVCCDDKKKSGNKTREKATVYCVDCRRNMCEQCFGYHQKFRLPGEHKLIQLDGEINTDELLLKFPDNVCDKHTDKCLEIYCFDCKVAVCMVCCVIDHNSHKFSGIKEVAEDLRKQMSAHDASLAANITQCQIVLQGIEENEKKFCNAVAETGKLICDRADKLKQLAEDYKHALLEQLSVAKNTQVKETANVRDEIERHRIVLENFIRYSTEVRQKGTACDIAKLASQLNARSEELQKFNIKTDLSVDYNTTEVTFTVSETDDALKSVFGDLSIDVHGYFKFSGKVAHIIPNSGGPVAGIAMLRDKMYVSRSGSSEIEVYNPTTFQLQQHLTFICDNCQTQSSTLPCPFCGCKYRNTYDMTLYGSQLDFYSGDIYDSQLQSQARSIAACDTNRCLYLSGQYPYIYKVALKQNNTLSYWSVDGNPQGLSVTNSHNLIVALYDSNALREYSTDGGFIRQINLQAAGISSPVHVVQLSNDLYAVTHHGPSHQFSIVNAEYALDQRNKEGYEYDDIVGEVYGRELTPVPRPVSPLSSQQGYTFHDLYDKTERFQVGESSNCDYTGECIYPDRRDRDHAGNIRNSHGFALDRRSRGSERMTYGAVSVWEAYPAQLNTLQPQLAANVGNKPKHHQPTHPSSPVNAEGQQSLLQSYRGDAGELNKPHGFALDRRNKIFMADRGNNRILVLEAKTLSAYPLKLPAGCQLNGPYSIHYDTVNDRLYIGECNGGRIICCQLCLLSWSC